MENSKHTFVFDQCSLLSVEQQAILSKWLLSEGQSVPKWKLSWRGSRDGFGAKIFHSLCDCKGESVVVIKTDEEERGYLFGGYSSVSWDASKHGTDENGPGSFIFTFTNPHRIPPTKYSLEENQKAVFHDENEGPIFGYSDIQVASNCNVGGYSSYTNFPSYYVDTTGKEKKTFTGDYYFTVGDIEVFTRN